MISFKMLLDLIFLCRSSEVVRLKIGNFLTKSFPYRKDLNKFDHYFLCRSSEVVRLKIGNFRLNFSCQKRFKQV